jgi:hypothetical protein
LDRHRDFLRAQVQGDSHLPGAPASCWSGPQFRLLRAVSSHRCVSACLTDCPSCLAVLELLIRALGAPRCLWRLLSSGASLNRRKASPDRPESYTQRPRAPELLCTVLGELCCAMCRWWGCNCVSGLPFVLLVGPAWDLGQSCLGDLNVLVPQAIGMSRKCCLCAKWEDSKTASSTDQYSRSMSRLSVQKMSRPFTRH